MPLLTELILLSGEVFYKYFSPTGFPSRLRQCTDVAGFCILLIIASEAEESTGAGDGVGHDPLASAQHWCESDRDPVGAGADCR
jgi:hypothetical protein